MTLLPPVTRFPLVMLIKGTLFTIVERYNAYAAVDPSGEVARWFNTRIEVENALDFAYKVQQKNVQTCEDYCDSATLNAVEFTAWNDKPAARYPLNVFDILAVVAASAAAYIVGGK